MFKQILVPYDGSEQSEKALDMAIDIAKSLNKGAKTAVLVLHVIAEFPKHHFIERPARSIRTGQKTTLSIYLQEVYDMMKESAENALKKKKDQIKKLHDFEIRIIILAAGHISDTIINVAMKEGADLIVIGNVGRSGVSKLRTLGSVSRGVSERSPCPIMIVH